MDAVFCLLVGLFFAASIYLMLSSHLVRILLGVSIFGNAVNLLIFTAGRLSGPAPPVLAPTKHGPGGAADAAVSAVAAAPTTEPITPIGEHAVSASMQAGANGSILADTFASTANPLPQALILTAIVISFSIFAFLLVLTFRAYQALETDNVDDMRVAEGDPARPPLGY